MLATALFRGPYICMQIWVVLAASNGHSGRGGAMNGRKEKAHLHTTPLDVKFSPALSLPKAR